MDNEIDVSPLVGFLSLLIIWTHHILAALEGQLGQGDLAWSASVTLIYFYLEGRES